MKYLRDSLISEEYLWKIFSIAWVCFEFDSVLQENSAVFSLAFRALCKEGVS